MFIELTKVTNIVDHYEPIDNISVKKFTTLQETKVYINVDKIHLIEHSLMTDDGAYIEMDDAAFDVKESYDVVKNMISFASRENHSL